VHSPQFN